MQYALKSALHKCVSRSPERPVLTKVVLTVPPKPRSKKAAWTGWFMATDTYQAVKIPVTFDELDEPVAGTYAIDPSVFRDAKGVPLRLKKRGRQLSLVSPTGEHILEPAWNAVDFDKLVPERETSFEIGFNIDVLTTAIEGLGSKTVAIRFTLDGAGDPNNLRPMIVRPINEDGDDGRIALVMPMRIVR